MVKLDLDVNLIIILFGLFVSATVALIMRRHNSNQREYDSIALIGERHH